MTEEEAELSQGSYFSSNDLLGSMDTDEQQDAGCIESTKIEKSRAKKARRNTVVGANSGDSESDTNPSSLVTVKPPAKITVASRVTQLEKHNTKLQNKLIECEASMAAQKDKILTLETLNKTCMDKLQSLTEGVEQLKTAQLVQPLNQASSLNWSGLFDKGNTNSRDSTMPIMATMMQREASSKANKQNSVTVNGLKTSLDLGTPQLTAEANKVIFKSFINQLKLDPEQDVKRHYMTRPKDTNKSPLLIVEFTELVHQQTALRNAKYLRNFEQYKTTYVNKDLTPLEHATEMKLREERNKRYDALTQIDNSSGRPTKFGTQNGKEYYWGIRWGYLQKIDRESRRILF